MCNRKTKCCIELTWPGCKYENSPVCCIENLGTMLKDLATVFNRNNLHYWLDWGALLGLIREDRLIPYDKDLDIGIFMEDLPKLGELRGEIEKLGYYYCPTKGLGYDGNVQALNHPRIFFSKTNKLFCDICLWADLPEEPGFVNLVKHAAEHLKVHKGPKKFYENLKSFQFDGVDIKIPCHTNVYLEMRYGLNWRNPDPHFYDNLNKARSYAKKIDYSFLYGEVSPKEDICGHYNLYYLDKYSNAGTAYVEFAPNGELLINGGITAKWSNDGDKIFIRWHHKPFGIAELLKSGSQITGFNTHENGNKFKWTLVKCLWIYTKNGYIPGVWDILHQGHINVIKQAKLHCEYLHVGICSDRLAKIHGKNPVMNEVDRAKIVSSLKWPDKVHIYDNANQTEVIKSLNIDAFIVGEDFGHQGIKEHDSALEYCIVNKIKIIRIPRYQQVSSTELKDKIKNGQERNN